LNADFLCQPVAPGFIRRLRHSPAAIPIAGHLHLIVRKDFRPIRTWPVCRSAKTGSARNEVRGDIGAVNLFALIADVGAAIEPERLAHISLGQENPRMRMNASPG